MKTAILLLAILLAGHVVQADPPGTGDDEKNTYRFVRSNFSNPPAAYRTAPLWVWNGRESREEIDRQLSDFKERHIGGVFIHPRPGLITPYLSDEWFLLVRHAADRAKALGMELWLYDENSYPSGFAGGHVPAEMPESYNQGQGLHLSKTSRLEKDQNYFLVLKQEGANFKDITSSIAEERGHEGSFYTFQLVNYPTEGRYGGFSYVDLLVDGVTEKFIEKTMEGYEKYVGNEFGGLIPGIFTDEPNIRAPQKPGSGSGRETLRYSPGLFEKFRARWGYDLKSNLVSLYEEIGDWRRVRHNYQALLLEWFIDRWSKPWYDYTERVNLNWTGHYWEHGWPSPEHGGDNMAMYAWHQVPGIDMLFNTEELRPDQFGNVRAVKELSSVANQFNRRRALSETYGASGWELRFEDMKRLGDWEFVLGVNLMNQHLSYSTIKGARKRDFPQSFSYHTPWWEHYDVLVDYFGRLSLALSSGQQINTILVLEPTTTAWMYAVPGEMPPDLRMVGDTFESFLDSLEMYQVEYDLGSENIIKDQGAVHDANFVVGQRAYDLVVLPPGMENLDSSTLLLLDRYMAQGGRVLAFTEPPSYIDGTPSDHVYALNNRYSEQWIRSRSIEDPGSLSLLSPSGFEMIQPASVDGRLFHQRRRLEEGQMLFLANFSKEDQSVGQLVVRGRSVEQLDLFTGLIKPYPVRPEGEERLSVAFDIPPAGSLLLFVSDTGSPVIEIQRKVSLEERVPGSSLEITRLEPNVLALDYVNYKTGELEGDGIYFYTAVDSIFKHHGFDVYGFGYNPWNVAVQFKNQIVEQDSFPKGSGYRACYLFEVDREFKNGSPLRLVTEWPHLYKVFVNARPVQPIPGAWWLDRSFGVFEIGQLIMPGTNRIAIIAMPMSVHAELEPVYLLGDFGLESIEHGWKIVQPRLLTLGPWNEQKHPLYAHSVAYARTFDVTDTETGYRVRLNDWEGTVAEVRVNGEKAGVIGWKPYECDVSGRLKPGKNVVEVVVYGSLKNTLGPHHNNPRPGIVTPWSFFYAPAEQPPGDQYDTIRYGLFDDFDLIRLISTTP